MKKKVSDRIKIYYYLLSGQSMTALECLKIFNSFKMSSRVSELKAEGYLISSETIVKNNKHYSRYFMTKDQIDKNTKKGI